MVWVIGVLLNWQLFSCLFLLGWPIFLATCLLHRPLMIFYCFPYSPHWLCTVSHLLCFQFSVSGVSAFWITILKLRSASSDWGGFWRTDSECIKIPFTSYYQKFKSVFFFFVFFLSIQWKSMAITGWQIQLQFFLINFLSRFKVRCPGTIRFATPADSAEQVWGLLPRHAADKLNKLYLKR